MCSPSPPHAPPDGRGTSQRTHTHNHRTPGIRNPPGTHKGQGTWRRHQSARGPSPPSAPLQEPGAAVGVPEVELGKTAGHCEQELVRHGAPGSPGVVSEEVADGTSHEARDDVEDEASFTISPIGHHRTRSGTVGQSCSTSFWQGEERATCVLWKGASDGNQPMTASITHQWREQAGSSSAAA